VTLSVATSTPLALAHPPFQFSFLSPFYGIEVLARKKKRTKNIFRFGKLEGDYGVECVHPPSPSASFHVKTCQGFVVKQTGAWLFGDFLSPLAKGKRENTDETSSRSPEKRVNPQLFPSFPHQKQRCSLGIPRRTLRAESKGNSHEHFSFFTSDGKFLFPPPSSGLILRSR
jgi:hypothetical protein